MAKNGKMSNKDIAEWLLKIDTIPQDILDELELVDYLQKGKKLHKTGDTVSRGITKEQAEEIFSRAEKRKERAESRKSQRIKNYNTKKKIKKYVNSVRNALYNL